MGGITELRGEMVYLDTNVFVYAVEGFPEHQAFLAELFEHIETGEIAAVTSELTLAEVLVKPLGLGRQDVVELYEEMLQTSDHFSVPPVERAVLVAAAEHRARLGIALADAIHVATAVAAGCSVLLTNDKKMKVPNAIALKGLGT